MHTAIADEHSVAGENHERRVATNLPYLPNKEVEAPKHGTLLDRPAGWPPQPASGGARGPALGIDTSSRDVEDGVSIQAGVGSVGSAPLVQVLLHRPTPTS